MNSDLVQKMYDAVVEELTNGVEHGERMLPSLLIVLTERRKQLDACMTAFDKMNANLALSQKVTGIESQDTFRKFQVAESYLRTLNVAMESYTQAFNDCYAIANTIGILREKLEVFHANAKTPELVMGAPNALGMLEGLLKPKKEFGGN